MKIFDIIFLSKKPLLQKILWNRYTRGFVLWLVRLLPIKKNRVMLWSRAGEQYSCNPKAIAETIVSNPLYAKDFDIVFAFISPESFPEVPESIECVKIGTLQYFYLKATSHFLISNQNWWVMEGKRSSQKYIQTWHAGHGIKKGGLAVDMYSKPSPLKDAMLKDTSRIDLFLSNSAFSSSVFIPDLGYKGEILEKGIPRNDIFFSSEEKIDEISTKIRSIHNIPKDSKLVLYAPTFRDSYPECGTAMFNIDENRVIEAFEKRFGGKWYLLIRCHPFMKSYYKSIFDFSKDGVLDASEYSDPQELLIGCDALITDYSSIEMDFSLLKRPIFQFATDWKDYDRGVYISFQDLPFPFADNQKQLVDNIENFDSDLYLENLSKFNDDIIGLKDDGHASEYLIEWMKNKL